LCEPKTRKNYGEFACIRKTEELAD
jgi:hypothetical protein